MGVVCFYFPFWKIDSYMTCNLVKVESRRGGGGGEAVFSLVLHIAILGLRFGLSYQLMISHF